MALVVLDSVMLTVALPTIGRALEISPAASLRMVTAYQTALVMALLPCAALGESFGYRRVFAIGLALYMAAALMCAAAPSLPWLVAARFVEGLGAAAILALGVAILREIVSADRLGAAITWNALTVAICSAIGPSLGATIVSVADWRWLFAASVPLGLMALVLSGTLPSRAGTGRRPDFLSISLSAGGLALLFLAIDRLTNSPAFSLFEIVVAAACFLVLIRRELPKKSPLIPMDLLSIRLLRLSVLASICCFAGQTAGLLGLSFHLQHEFGQSPSSAGLYMTPWPVAVAVAALVSGRLANSVPTAWLCAVGASLLALGLLAFAYWPPEGGVLPLAGIGCVCGLGFGLFQVPNNRNMFLAAPPERSGAAGGLQGTARLFGQTTGAVTITIIFAKVPLDTAPTLAFELGAVLVGGAALISMLQLIGMRNVRV